MEGAAAIAVLNEQRAANSIPPITTVDQSFANEWCPNEDTGPGPSDIGRIMSSGDEWGPDVSPWDDGPLHQREEYWPLYRAAGDVNVDGTACMGLGDEEPTPTTPTTYAYLGDEGPRNVPTEIDVTNESPEAPQQFVGLEQGQPTGPQLQFFVYGLGPVNASVWSLTTAAGSAVPDVKMADNASVIAHGFGPVSKYEGGWMIPPPLKPGTRYDGTVTWTSDRGQITQTFSFTTAVAENLIGLYYHQGARVVHGQSDAPNGYLVFSRGGHKLRAAIKSRSGALRYKTTFPLSRLANGTWRVCAFSGGGSSGYQPKKFCTPLRVANGRAV